MNTENQQLLFLWLLSEHWNPFPQIAWFSEAEERRRVKKQFSATDPADAAAHRSFTIRYAKLLSALKWILWSYITMRPPQRDSYETSLCSLIVKLGRCNYFYTKYQISPYAIISIIISHISSFSAKLASIVIHAKEQNRTRAEALIWCPNWPHVISQVHPGSRWFMNESSNSLAVR